MFNNGFSFWDIRENTFNIFFLPGASRLNLD